MSAELVDPFALRPTISKDDLDVMVGDIHYHLIDARFDDPQLAPDLLNKALTELGRVATYQGTVDAEWATGVLQQLHHRAVSGIPYNEPREPADFFDRDERLPR